MYNQHSNKTKITHILITRISHTNTTSIIKQITNNKNVHKHEFYTKTIITQTIINTSHTKTTHTQKKNTNKLCLKHQISKTPNQHKHNPNKPNHHPTLKTNPHKINQKKSNQFSHLLF